MIKAWILFWPALLYLFIQTIQCEPTQHKVKLNSMRNVLYHLGKRDVSKETVAENSKEDELNKRKRFKDQNNEDQADKDDDSEESLSSAEEKLIKSNNNNPSKCYFEQLKYRTGKRTHKNIAFQLGKRFRDLDRQDQASISFGNWNYSNDLKNNIEKKDEEVGKYDYLLEKRPAHNRIYYDRSFAGRRLVKPY